MRKILAVVILALVLAPLAGAVACFAADAASESGGIDTAEIIRMIINNPEALATVTTLIGGLLTAVWGLLRKIGPFARFEEKIKSALPENWKDILLAHVVMAQEMVDATNAERKAKVEECIGELLDEYKGYLPAFLTLPGLYSMFTRRKAITLLSPTIDGLVKGLKANPEMKALWDAATDAALKTKALS